MCSKPQTTLLQKWHLVEHVTSLALPELVEMLHYGNFIIVMKLSSQVAVEVVNMTTSCAASDQNFIEKIFLFQCNSNMLHVYSEYSDALIWVYISPVFWPVLNVPLFLSPCGLIPGLMGIRTQGTPQSTNKDTQAFITSDYEVGTRGYTNMAINTISRNTAIENTHKTLWIHDCF